VSVKADTLLHIALLRRGHAMSEAVPAHEEPGNSTVLKDMSFYRRSQQLLGLLASNSTMLYTLLVFSRFDSCMSQATCQNSYTVCRLSAAG
jgi:hypothetical protein